MVERSDGARRAARLRKKYWDDFNPAGSAARLLRNSQIVQKARQPQDRGLNEASFERDPLVKRVQAKVEGLQKTRPDSAWLESYSKFLAKMRNRKVKFVEYLGMAEQLMSRDEHLEFLNELNKMPMTEENHKRIDLILDKIFRRMEREQRILGQIKKGK